MPRHRDGRQGFGARRIVATLAVAAVGLPLAVWWGYPPVATALGTFTVTTTVDAHDSDLTDGVCNDGTGECTLRAAVEQANYDGGATEIGLPAGVLAVNRPHPSGLGYDIGSIVVEGDITILGAGRAATVIEYDVSLRDHGIFKVLGGANLDISHLTLTSNRSPGSTGASGIVLPEDGASLLATDVLFDDLGDVAVAAWNIGPTPDPGNLDIRIHDSQFEGHNDSWNYSVLVDDVADTYVEVVDTVVNDMGYALLVAGDGQPGNVLRVVDSTFTNSSDAPPGAFEIYHGFAAEIVGTTITDHEFAVFGGSDLEYVHITDSYLANNTWYGISLHTKELVIDRTTIRDNGGFGIDHDGGPMHVSNSTISGNEDGIWSNHRDETPDTITNTTISGHVYNGLELSPGSVLRNVTVTGNGVGPPGDEYAAVFAYEDLFAYNTVVAGNGVDCEGGSLLGDHNEDGDGSCGLSGIDPMLGPLADNGGPTLTHLPLAGSPLIDAGDDAECAATDQRGGLRPYDGDGDGPAICDIGAVEAGAEIGTGPTLSWNADLARRGMLAPDGDLEVIVEAGGGGTASAQVAASSWYPGGDTGQPILAATADVVVDVALSETSPGRYTGTLPLTGFERIDRITAHVEVGTDIADLETTDGLPALAAGRLSLETASVLPTWMLPEMRVVIDSELGADGDAVVVPPFGSTPTRWLAPAVDYVVGFRDGQHQSVAPDTTGIEVRGGLVTPLVVPVQPVPHVPITIIARDGNGASVADVEVSVLDLATGDEVAQGVTGADGALKAVARGDSVVVEIDPREQPYEPFSDVVVITELDQQVDVGLGFALPTATISGVVSHPPQPGVPGLRVSFATEIGDRVFTTSTTTGEDGSYSADVFQGAVTIEVGNARSGLATESLDLYSDTVVDIALEGPLIVDLDVELLTRYAGEAAPRAVDLDWRTAAHYRLYSFNGRNRFGLRGRHTEVALYPGQQIEICADGAEAGLPAVCAVADVDVASATGSVSLLLEQVAAAVGVVEWTSPPYLDEGGYRPSARGVLYRVETDGSLTRVNTVPLRLLDDPSPANLDLEAEFSVSVPEAGEYELTFIVEHFLNPTCSYYAGLAGNCGEYWAGATSGRARINVVADTVVDVGSVPLTGGAADVFAFSPGSGTFISPATSLPGDIVTVRVAARNRHTSAVEGALRFRIPSGTTLVPGSVMLDGVAVTPTVTDGVVEAPSVMIEPDQTAVLRAWVEVDSDIAVDSLITAGSVARPGRVEELGISASVVRRLSLNSVVATSTPELPVWGRALPGSTVEVTVDEVSAAMVVATPGGTWSATLDLPETRLRRSFLLQAHSTGPSGALETVPKTVDYDTTLPTLQRAVFRQPDGRVVEIDPTRGLARFPYVWYPLADIIIDLHFDNPYRVGDPVVWVGSARSEAQFDAVRGIWRAHVRPSAGQLGEVRLEWTPLPYQHDFAPAVAAPALTPEELRELLPAELASFSRVEVVDETDGVATVEIDFPDLSEPLRLTFGVDEDEYAASDADLEFEADVGAPVWDLDVQVPTVADPSSALTFAIPVSQLNLPEAAAAPVSSERLIEALPPQVVKLLKMSIDNPKAFGDLFASIVGAHGLLGAGLADVYLDGLTRAIRLADAACPAFVANQFQDDIDHLADLYAASVALNIGLLIIGLVLGPETFGLGTLALVAISEAINYAIAQWLDNKLADLMERIRTTCDPNPGADPDPDDLFDNPEPCIPEWNLVPPSLGGPACDPIADPTYVHDPSGFVYEVVEDERLEGVTATVQTAASAAGPWSVWDAEWFLQENPLVTDPEGRYGWDVPEGWWRVKYELDGYETGYSDALEVLPPHFDVNVGLRNLAVPAVDSVDAFAGATYIDVTFDQWMDVASMPDVRVEVEDGAGNEVATSLSFPDEVASAAGPLVAHTMRIDLGQPLAAGDVFDVELDRMLQSAGAVPLGAEQQFDVTVSKAPQSIELVPITDRTYGDAPVAVSATATSGLPASIATAGSCSNAGATVTIVGAGSCTVTASQAGDDVHAAAADVEDTFEISAAALTVTAVDTLAVVGTPEPPLTASASGLVAGDTLASLGGVSCSSDAPTAAGLLSTVGEYTITCSGPSTGDYDVDHVDGTLTVTSATPDAVPLEPARVLETRPGLETVDGLFAGIGRPVAGSVTKVRIAGVGESDGGVP
jgi:hypothetical protein